MTDNIITPDVWNDPWKREELVLRRPRIRRSPEPPDELSRELAQPHRYPYRLQIPVGDLRVVYRRGRWHDINEESEETSAEGWDASVDLRETVAWVLRGEERVGGFAFLEIDVPLFDEEAFCEWADAFDLHLGVLAEYCCASWEDFSDSPAGYGSIVEIQVIWAKPRAMAPGEWLPVLEALLARLCKKASLVVAHAFPLEYTCRAGEEDVSRRGFTRRQAAMISWAKRKLGFQPFPGQAGEEGWLWKPARRRIAKYIETPEWEPRWREKAARGVLPAND